MKSGLKKWNRGFTLIEIIIALAIMAILAGAITPLVFKELVKAKEEATEIELAVLQDGLLDFYEDTGQFPSEVEGLSALVIDPGVDGWQGPYVTSDRNDPSEDVGEDSFGNPYQYDLAPATNPAGAADAIIASGGSDHAVSFGSVGGTWTIAGDGDDLLTLVTAGPMNRDKINAGENEMEAIGEASRRYFEENAEFPSDTDDLTDGYLDEGMNGDALVDPWNRLYELIVDDSGDTPVLSLRSYGPDRQDDNGSDDDLTLTISSVPPGRQSTRYLLSIAQTVLNNNSGLDLDDDWGDVREDLDLAAAFEADGWGRDFQINPDSRVVYSSGPDGVPSTTSDNIPSGVGPPSGGGNNGGGGGSDNGNDDGDDDGNNGGGNSGGNNGNN